MDPTLHRFQRRLVRWLEGGLGPCWVVAISGGSDSVGLLRLLHACAAECGLRLSVAHLDHGARGEAARLDAEFVAELAGSLGLPFDLGHWSPSRPAHFEADARRARYAWLAEVARRRGASAVAVGHTRDDQAETILHRIVRGTGLRGLAGIPRRRGLGGGLTLVRPLLDLSRDEIRAYLEGIGQGYRDDATNADASRTRARLRHDLLPRLAREYNPAVAEALVRLGALASASAREWDARLRARARAATLWADGESVGLDRQALRGYSPFVRAEVLRLAWRRAGWPEGAMSARRWRRLAALAAAGRGRRAVGAGVVVEVDHTLFAMHRAPTPGGGARPEGASAVPRAAEVPLELPGSAPWPPGRVVATLDAADPADERVDLDRLAPPLSVRAPAAGDRFAPLGMGGRSMPLNDFFRGCRIPRRARSRVPLVCDREGIVWVVGHRIADRARVTEATRRTVGLRWSAGPDGAEGCD